LILVDSPPVIAVTDPVVLSPEVDGVVMIIKSGSTSGDAAVRSKSLLENANARILGAILNGVQVGGLHGRYGHYYHYQYSSYYTDEGEKKGRRRDT
jgi:Mrp family chromosome partitioning ATPase